MQIVPVLEEKATESFEPSDVVVGEVRQACHNLENYLANLKKTKDSLSAEEHEAAILRFTRAIGQASIGEMLACYDMSDDIVSVGSQTYRRKHKAPKTYQTSLGPVTVTRYVYVNRKSDGTGKSIVPMELQSGIVENYWSAQAAKNSAWLLAHLTPQETEDALFQLGMMTPSRSSLDRLPKALMSSWDQQVVEQHKLLTEQEDIPEEAVSMAVSLDGVMIGMKPDKNTEKQGKNRQCEWKEASCGTISFFDNNGNRLATTQYGRMPEHKKQSLKNMLRNHVEVALKIKPELKLIHIADGAQDNWTFFDEDMPLGFQLTDYFHACQYLKKAFDAAYESQKSNEQYHKYKRILRDEEKGIRKVLRALRYLRNKHKNCADIKSAVTYFTNNQHRMLYAEANTLNYPIGSGIVEAACKSLVSQRMKRSGMSWNQLGGQSILTLRSLIKSHRFDKAWEGIAEKYQTTIIRHENVVNLFG